MSDGFDSLLRKKLDQRAQDGTFRQLPAIRPDLVDFASNDYLGLARSADLAARIEKEISRMSRKNGSTGSRLLTGNDPYTEEVEAELAETFSAEHALIFNSGYTANLAVLSSIPQKGDTIIYDELAHASIKDGARLSLARRFSFAHNDVDDLERKIRLASGRVYIVVESVYSMDGDVCPLNDIYKLAERTDATIILDEAHSTGVIGKDGGGLAVELGLTAIPIRIFTFGKAMGVHGACVAGGSVLRNYLINFARPFIYTTAANRHAVASIRCAVTFVKEHPALVQKLKENITLFLDGIRGLQNRTPSTGAIQTLIIPGADEVRSVATALQSNGMDVRPIVTPTVAVGMERLRICLHAYNSTDEIQKLTTLLKSHASFAQ